MRALGDGSYGQLLFDGRAFTGQRQSEHEVARVARLGAIAYQLKGLCQCEISGAGGPEPHSPSDMRESPLIS